MVFQRLDQFVAMRRSGRQQRHQDKLEILRGELTPRVQPMPPMPMTPPVAVMTVMPVTSAALTVFLIRIVMEPGIPEIA